MLRAIGGSSSSLLLLVGGAASIPGATTARSLIATRGNGTRTDADVVDIDYILPWESTLLTSRQTTVSALSNRKRPYTQSEKHTPKPDIVLRNGEKTAMKYRLS
jgi:hypothetical protein